MAWSRLALYNVACLAVGERPLDTLSESNEIRRKLDEVYTRGLGAIRFFMEQGHWNFAMRAVRIDADSAAEPEFGFTEAFSKPSDFCKLNMISADEYFSIPLGSFEDEGAYWYANADPIYVRYVSDDEDWGGDFSKWTESFAMWAGTWMGLQIAPSLTSDLDLERLEKRTRRLLVEARSNDATGEPVRYPPLSSWASSRLGGRAGRRDRGSRSRLLG